MFLNVPPKTLCKICVLDMALDSVAGSDAKPRSLPKVFPPADDSGQAAAQGPVTYITVQTSKQHECSQFRGGGVCRLKLQQLGA